MFLQQIVGEERFQMSPRQFTSFSSVERLLISRQALITKSKMFLKFD